MAFTPKAWVNSPTTTTPVSAAALIDAETRVTDYTNAQITALSLPTIGKGYINHGATAGTARPSGFASIEWQGTVSPTNAITGDTWIDTT